MSKITDEALQDYIANPFGTLYMKGVRIGRVSIEEINIAGREAAINTQEFFQTVLDKTRSITTGKNGTRYPAPLPVATLPGCSRWKSRTTWVIWSVGACNRTPSSPPRAR